LTGKKVSATDQILLEVISAAISVLGGHEKVHLGHLIPHRERAGMFSSVHIKSLALHPEDATYHITWWK
jgi:hypothetical protein